MCVYVHIICVYRHTDVRLGLTARHHHTYIIHQDGDGMLRAGRVTGRGEAAAVQEKEVRTNEFTGQFCVVEGGVF